MKKLPTKQKGFTLVELIVSIAAFTIVIVIGLGSVVTTSRTYQRSISQSEAIDSLSFAMDTMSRRIRTGINYGCDSICTTQGNERFVFDDQGQSQVIYSLEESPEGKYIQRVTNTGSESFTQVLTSPKVINISDMKFYVIGQSNTDQLQPRVQIVIKGQTRFGTGVSDFSLQTTVVQRQIDVIETII